MGLFQSIQDLLGGATDSLQGSVGDVLGGLNEVPGLQEIQDQISTVTDGATQAVTSVTEQGQTAVEDITQNLGL
jgi:hypothetical protein